MLLVEFDKENTSYEDVDGKAHNVRYGNHPERGCVAQELSHYATQENAKAKAKIPRCEDGAIGRAAFVVVCHANDHVLKGWPKVSVAKSDKHCRKVVAEHGWPRDEQHIPDGGKQDSDKGILGKFAFS